MPGETAGDPRYAIVFIRDITDSKKEAAQIAALTQQNKAMDMLLQSTVKLVDRYFLCNLSTDEYTFYNMLSAASRPSSGCYHDLVAYFLAQFQPIGGERTLEESLSPLTCASSSAPRTTSTASSTAPKMRPSSRPWPFCPSRGRTAWWNRPSSSHRMSRRKRRRRSPPARPSRMLTTQPTAPIAPRPSFFPT